MHHLFRHYFRHICHCPECDMYFHEMEHVLRHWHHHPHRHHKYHHHRKHWFSDNLRYTNKLTEKIILEKHLDNFQRNLTSHLPNFFMPSAYIELSIYERFIENKYIAPCGGDLPLVDAVIFVPKKTMTAIKTRVIIEGGHGIDQAGDNYPPSLIDPMAEELRDREFDDRERFNDNERGEENNEPNFNEPNSEDGENGYGRIVENGKIVGTKTWVETMSLLGCCCKMTLKELNNEISKQKLDNVIFENSTQITDEDLENNGNENLNVIFLCEETLKDFSNSISKDDKQSLYKTKVGKRFNVAIMNDYFIDNALRLTFAHELGHILFGHLENTTKMQVNRETQANFMASLMLNDKIDSIYMQYKTNFQPREYKRTLLLHNDFNSSNFTKAFLKVSKLK